MTLPSLSIVTISFNQAQYLRQCVDSVVLQKDNDVEYVVVDPGSTDGSREILKSYGDAIDHLVLQSDNGPADGLNKGFARATGEVGYFLNSDDFILPGAIDRMRRLWAENHNIDILLGGAWMVDGYGEPLRELEAVAPDLRSLLSGDATLVQQGMSFRLARFHDTGGFELANRTCWDYELLCALLDRGARSLVTKERFGVFRIHGDSLSGGVGGARHAERYMADLDRIHRLYAGRPIATRSGLASALVRLRRLLSRPTTTLSHALDSLFPQRMRSRFNSDRTGSCPGQC
jgi:glycosyltransferase involved in cell wall biosynthesis